MDWEKFANTLTFCVFIASIVVLIYSLAAGNVLIGAVAFGVGSLLISIANGMEWFH